MRAFVAAELPERFVEQTHRLSHLLRERMSGRFARSNTYHLTLAFLGDIDDADAARAMDALDAACTQVEPLSIRACGLGTFGKKSDATLWLDVDGGSELGALAAQVRDELACRDVAFDPKPFKAHVTLARHVAIPKQSLGDLAFPEPALLRTITLFKSILLPDGAQYKPLYRIELPIS